MWVFLAPASDSQKKMLVTTGQDSLSCEHCNFPGQQTSATAWWHFHLLLFFGITFPRCLLSAKRQVSSAPGTKPDLQLWSCFKTASRPHEHHHEAGTQHHRRFVPNRKTFFLFIRMAILSTELEELQATCKEFLFHKVQGMNPVFGWSCSADSFPLHSM